MSIATWSNVGFSQFRSERDRLIVRDVLRTFKQECVQKTASDGELIKRLEIENTAAARNAEKDISKCYEGNYSQIVGVYYLYNKLCGDVSSNPPRVPDIVASRQLLEVNRYKGGIRSYHTVLNDCLERLPKKKGLPFAIPLLGAGINMKSMTQQLDLISVDPPFSVTGIPLR